MSADLFGGKYTVEEIQRIMSINSRPSAVLKPFNPMYKKSAMEHAPSWREKREVSNMIAEMERLKISRPQNSDYNFDIDNPLYSSFIS